MSRKRKYVFIILTIVVIASILGAYFVINHLVDKKNERDLGNDVSHCDASLTNCD